MSKQGSQKDFSAPEDEHRPLLSPPAPDAAAAAASYKQKALLISFLLMVVVGLQNKIWQKEQTLPMHNYPYFLATYTSFVYIPLSFAYILPMIKWGSYITAEQRAIPWYKFGVMGALDGIAGIMQSFAVNYLGGSLVILLTQSAIPISMLISRVLLKAKYNLAHYIGALIVVAGLITVLVPTLIHKDPNDTITPLMKGIWSGVLILSCIPMTLSSVYKEKALGETEIDVVYLNGWVAVYQFLISIPLAIPAAYATSLTIQELPNNIWGGMKCYVGINSIMHNTYGSDGKVTIPMDDCKMAPYFVNAYIFFNVLYNILIILILKYGSANILWLALTIMVPLGNIAFALHFMPGHQPLHPTDIAGLVVIMTGLIVYRFWDLIMNVAFPRRKRELDEKAAAALANESGSVNTDD